MKDTNVVFNSEEKREPTQLEILRKEKSELIRKYKGGLELFAGLPEEQKKAMRESTCKKLADILISIAEIDVNELS